MDTKMHCSLLLFQVTRFASYPQMHCLHPTPFRYGVAWILTIMTADSDDSFPLFLVHGNFKMIRNYVGYHPVDDMFVPHADFYTSGSADRYYYNVACAMYT